MRLHRTRLALTSLVAVSALGFTACGADAESAADSSGSTGEETTSATPKPESTDSTEETAGAEVTESPESPESAESPAEASASGGQPTWANPVTEPGELLSSIEAGDLTVDVYQVGTMPADDTGSFVDPGTNTPLIEVGDTLVFLNYVVSNNGAAVDLGSSLVDVSARYDDWPYMQGMDGLTGDELWVAQGINEPGLSAEGYSEAGIYTFEPGQRFSYGDNFEHQPGSPITFDVTYIPVDAGGELLHDERVEAEGTATIS